MEDQFQGIRIFVKQAAHHVYWVEQTSSILGPASCRPGTFGARAKRGGVNWEIWTRVWKLEVLLLKWLYRPVSKHTGADLHESWQIWKAARANCSHWQHHIETKGFGKRELPNPQILRGDVRKVHVDCILYLISKRGVKVRVRIELQLLWTWRLTAVWLIAVQTEGQD